MIFVVILLFLTASLIEVSFLIPRLGALLAALGPAYLGKELIRKRLANSTPSVLDMAGDNLGISPFLSIRQVEIYFTNGEIAAEVGGLNRRPLVN